MTLNLYALKNRMTGIFERPFAEIYDEKEYPELLTQSLCSADVPVLSKHKEYDLYKVGSFDTKSGQVADVCCDFVVSLEPICLSILKNKEVKEDVGRQENA